MNNNAQEDHDLEIKEFGESINRLDEIKEEIFDLVNEAATIVRRKVGRNDYIYRRAEAYWIPTIRKTLKNNEEYGTLDQTIIEMEVQLDKMKEEAHHGTTRTDN